MSIECGKSRAQPRCCVPLNDEQFRALLRQVAVEQDNRPGTEGRQLLIRLHQVQVHIRFDVELPQDLIQHLPVLSRRAYPALNRTLASSTPQ